MTETNLTGLPDTLGSAKFLGHFVNQSEEWHYLRSLGIGGSDISAIVGVNPWQSSYNLAATRLGKIPNTFEPSEAMEWGTRLESAILDKFQDNHPDFKLHREVGSWCNVERPFQQANPDAIFEKDGEYGIIEVKTARYEDDWRDGVPAYYKTQVQWYLHTFGFSKAHVAVLFSGSKYKEFEIEADVFEQGLNLDAATHFWGLICNGELPDFSQPFLSTYTATREMHPDIEDTEVELGQLGIEYSNAVSNANDAESDLNHMRARVLDAMGKAKKGTIDGDVVVTRQARSGGTPYLVQKRK
jgi:putative phage-type endonuclease